VSFTSSHSYLRSMPWNMHMLPAAPLMSGGATQDIRPYIITILS
jgi:hypothetical protein